MLGSFIPATLHIEYVLFNFRPCVTLVTDAASPPDDCDQSEVGSHEYAALQHHIGRQDESSRAAERNLEWESVPLALAWTVGVLPRVYV